MCKNKKWAIGILWYEQYRINTRVEGINSLRYIPESQACILQPFHRIDVDVSSPKIQPGRRWRRMWERWQVRASLLFVILQVWTEDDRLVEDDGDGLKSWLWLWALEIDWLIDTKALYLLYLSSSSSVDVDTCTWVDVLLEASCWMCGSGASS